MFATSRRTWFYTYDLESGTIDRVPGVRGREEKSFESSYVSPDGKHLVLLGKDGYLVLISTKTKQWVADMKMNGTSRAVCFSPSGDIMYSYGGDGQVYVWDMKTRDCVHRFIDEGSIHGTAIAASADGSYLACG